MFCEVTECMKKVKDLHGDVWLKSFQDAVKIMAKDLVRTRRYVKKFIMMKANIQAVSLKIQTLKSNNSMAQAMKGVTKAMATMNRQVCDAVAQLRCSVGNSCVDTFMFPPSCS